ncbi:DAF factor, partial [Polioptila caerulea]|nr:DAF factor [Polioptila caerulea]
CHHPPSVEFADIQSRREFLVGTTVTYSCRAGFSLIPGVSPTITCLQNFTWSSVPRLCQTVRCPKPVVERGRMTPQTFTFPFGLLLHFSCDEG